MTETKQPKFRDRDSYTTLQMEAALCAWEWMCENREHEQLKPHFESHGSAVMRHCSMQAGDIALRVHDHMTAQGFEFVDAFDWEFVPGVLLRLDWQSLIQDNQFAGLPYQPDPHAIFCAMFAEDRARYTEATHRAFHKTKVSSEWWVQEARAAAEAQWCYADLISDHVDAAKIAWEKGEDPISFSRELGEELDLTPAAEWRALG